jgi:hypothetical protein
MAFSWPLRFVNRAFQEYGHPDRAELFRLINCTMEELRAGVVSEMSLSDDLRDMWGKVAPKHRALQKVIVDGHSDLESVVHLLRIIFENANGTAGGRMEYSTWMDEGQGSTSKGTVRSWCEHCLGVFSNNEAARGYVGIMTQPAVAPKPRTSGEAPTEQWANLEGCCMAFIDDFNVSPANPLDNSALKRISGMNNLTAARKGKGERGFTFMGHLILMCNGIWYPSSPFGLADDRRINGLSYNIRYVNCPEGPNEKQKDASIKNDMKELFAEFWFLARCFWLAGVAFPSTTETVPLCPEAIGIRERLLARPIGGDVDLDVVDKFLEEKTTIYTIGVAKPSTRDEIADELVKFLLAKSTTVEHKTAKDLLAKRCVYKAACPLPAYPGRKRTSVNVLQKKNPIGALVTITLASGPAAASA